MSWFLTILLIVVLIIIIAIIATIIVGIIFVLKFIGYILGFIVGFIINWGIQIGILIFGGWLTFGIPNIVVWLLLAISGAIGSSIISKNWWWLLSIPLGVEIFFANLFAMGIANITGSTPKATFIAITSEGAAPLTFDASKTIGEVINEIGNPALTRVCFSDTDTCADESKAFPLDIVKDKTLSDMSWDGRKKVILM